MGHFRVSFSLILYMTICMNTLFNIQNIEINLKRELQVLIAF
jgi:hypothetical protein